MQSDFEPRFSFLSCSCRLTAEKVLNGNGFLNPLHQLLASSEDLPLPLIKVLMLSQKTKNEPSPPLFHLWTLALIFYLKGRGPGRGGG